MEHSSVVLSKISKLNSQLIHPATKVYNKCLDLKIPIHIIWTKRSVIEQDVLYKFGRTVPGKIITMHTGGYSPHNYGLALDFCLVYNGKLVEWHTAYKYKILTNYWNTAIKLFEEEGWESGWVYQNFEPGHVQNLLGKDINYYLKGLKQ